MHVVSDASSESPGWSLLPLIVIIVLTFVNVPCPLQGPLSISTRPGSATLLPVGTTSTGLLHLLVGARVHHVRSDTGNCHVWLLLQAHHFQCVTYIQNKIYNNNNNALLHGPEFFWLSSFGIERQWRGGGCVLGSVQPEHITHLPYILTTLTFSPPPHCPT